MRSLQAPRKASSRTHLAPILDHDLSGVPRQPWRTRRSTASAVISAIGLAVLLMAAILGFFGLETRDMPNRVKIQYTAHDPITIFFDSNFTSANGVTGGSGTAEDPYVISGWDISTERFDGCIFIMWTTAHYVIRDCHIHTPGAVCIEVQLAPHGDIENCTVDSGDLGIVVLQSSDTNVTGNIVTNMDTAGILVGSSNWVNVTRNLLTNDNISAISCSRVANATIVDNIASSNNHTGILIGNATDIEIAGNNASENGGDGIRIDDARNLQAWGNNITSNSGCGLNLSNATGGSVYHNRFIGNGLQAYQEYSTAVAWDDGYPSGGNYWSDHIGMDAFSGPGQDVPGSDGIGDTPYSIPGGVSDNYPFVTESLQLVPEFKSVLPSAVIIVVMFLCLFRRKMKAPTHRDGDLNREVL